jgi:hypothetical protein
VQPSANQEEARKSAYMRIAAERPPSSARAASSLAQGTPHRARQCALSACRIRKAVPTVHVVMLPGVNASPAFFDDVALLRLMYRLHTEGRLTYMTGEQLMTELGAMAGDDAQRRGFVHTLHVAAEDELIGFDLVLPLGRRVAPRPDEYQYIANLRNFRLRTKGLDRAQGRCIIQDMPEQDRDDGRRVPNRVLLRVASGMGADLTFPEAIGFLIDNGVPRGWCPDVGPTAMDAGACLHAVPGSLLERGGDARRLALRLIGKWLNDDLEIVPTDQAQAEVIAELARVGWHVADDGVLVIGERVKANRRTTVVSAPDDPPNPAKARKVMVVYGRDSSASRAMFDFLRALRLEPQEWGQLVNATGSGAPYTGEVLDRALEIVQAVVVLFTPDDEARLRADLAGPADIAEAELRGQPRPNVLFEAGLAIGRHPTRTLLVELGQLRGLSDLFGRHAVRLGRTAEPLHDLAERLRTAECAVDTSGTHWLDPHRFAVVLR